MSGAHDHDHDDGDHDHDHSDHEPTEAEIALARARVQQLSDALEAISLEELDAHLAKAGLTVRKAVAAKLALRLDPRFLKGGIGRLVRARIRKLHPHARVEMAAELTAPLDAETVEFLGESYEEPAAEQIEALVDHLVATFPVSLVRTYLAVTAAAQATVAPQLDGLLRDDPRLALESNTDPAPAD